MSATLKSIATTSSREFSGSCSTVLTRRSLRTKVAAARWPKQTCPRLRRSAGPAVPGCKRVRPHVLRQLDRRAAALFGERLVVETRDDVQMRMVLLLLRLREAVPDE